MKIRWQNENTESKPVRNEVSTSTVYIQWKTKENRTKRKAIKLQKSRADIQITS